MSGQKIVVESKPSKDGTKITILLSSKDEISILAMVSSVLDFIDMLCKKHGVQFDEDGNPGFPRNKKEAAH